MAQHYNLIASWNRWALEEIIEKKGAAWTRAWLEGLTEAELALLQADPYFHLRPKQVIDWKMLREDTGKPYFGTFMTSGRALHKDEKILTPQGFKRFGDLKVGDKIYDENGKVCNVLEIHQQPKKKTYRIHFTDHSYIDSCGEHLWTVWGHRDRKQYLRQDAGENDNGTFPPTNWPKFSQKLKRASKTNTRDEYGAQTLSTEQLIQNFYIGKRGDNNWCIPLCKPVELPEADLPIAPHFCGLWLGDGTQGSGTFSVHKDDKDFYIESAKRAGYPLLRSEPSTDPSKPNTWHLSFGDTYNLRSEFKGKIIPKEYLFGSIEQRKEFLAGLLDSDGFADENKIEFCSMRKDHAEAVMWLARSLGQRPTLVEGRAKLNGKDYGIKYRVHWKPSTEEMNPFKLKRKADRLTYGKSQESMLTHRMMTKWEYLGEQEDFMCITVDSPNSLFLIGEALIPTHNSFGKSYSGSCFMVTRALHGFNNLSIVGKTANDVETKMCAFGPSSICEVYKNTLFVPEYSAHKRRMIFPNGVVALTYSMDNPDQARGMSGSTSWTDELASAMYGELAISNIEFGVREGQYVHNLVTTTPEKKEFIQKLYENPSYRKVHGSSLENRYTEKAEAFREMIAEQDPNSPTYRREVLGIIDWDSDDALWRRNHINRDRVDAPPHNNFFNIVVAVDPTSGSGLKKNDEAGIMVVASIRDESGKLHAYILEDATCKGMPEVWAKEVEALLQKYPNATVYAERNGGGEMVRTTLEGQGVPFYKINLVQHINSKYDRAQPISLLAKAGYIHHVGNLDKLEDELCSYTRETKKSPNRMDAMVIGVSALLVTGTGQVQVKSMFGD